MKTAIQSVMDIIEMEHNNGVEISQRVLWNMLSEAKETEKQQIIDAYKQGLDKDEDSGYSDPVDFYNETYTTNKETFK